MKYLLFFSWRSIFRNKLRTLLLIASIAFSIAWLSLIYNLSDSSTLQIQQQVRDSYTGASQLSHKDFSLVDEQLKTYKFLRPLDITQIGVSFAPRIYAPVYIAVSKKTVGLMMIGVDARTEKKFTKIHEALSSGEFLDDPSESTIILGEKLAQILEVGVGSEVILLSQGVDGSVANDVFFVKGLLKLGSQELEEKVIFVNLGKAREFLSMPEGSFHTLISNIPFPPRLMKKFNVVSWQELLPDVHGPIELFSRFLYLLTFALTLVVSIGISNTIYVSFNERQTELTSLNIIGAKPTWISLSLFLEVFVLLSLSSILGLIFSLAINQYYNSFPANLSFLLGGKDLLLGGMKISPYIKVIHHLENYLRAIGVVIGFVLFSSLYPLLTATKETRN